MLQIKASERLATCLPLCSTFFSIIWRKIGKCVWESRNQLDWRYLFKYSVVCRREVSTLRENGFSEWILCNNIYNTWWSSLAITAHLLMVARGTLYNELISWDYKFKSVYGTVGWMRRGETKEDTETHYKLMALPVLLPESELTVLKKNDTSRVQFSEWHDIFLRIVKVCS